LVESVPDLLAIETIPSIAEAEALVEVLDALPELRAWISFTCADAATLADGSSFADAVSSVAEHQGVVAVGVNCTAPAYLAELVSTARRHTDKPIVAYPNRGGVWDAVAKQWHGSGDEELPRLAQSWADAGAQLIGGCCGTSAPDIRDIGVALADRRIRF
jgi:homocysteine S-methyltransferase